MSPTIRQRWKQFGDKDATYAAVVAILTIMVSVIAAIGSIITAIVIYAPWIFLLAIPAMIIWSIYYFIRETNDA